MKSTLLILLLFIFKFQLGLSAVLNNCVCGEQSDEGIIILKTEGRKIVNGTEVRPHKFPWMAVMVKGQQHVCGGTIISDRNIITAGHCFHYIPSPRRTQWITGVHSIKGFSRSKLIKTLDFRYHPRFFAGDLYDNYDMAVVTVERPIMFGTIVKPICLPNPDEHKLYYNQKLTVAGWGRIYEKGPSSDVLMETQVFLKTPERCQQMMNGIQFDDDSMLCAHDDYTDACQGDSGSPLFVEKNGFNILLGTVSFGDGCARDFPGIYGKVTTDFTLNWIRNYIASTNANVCANPSKLSNRLNFFSLDYYEL